jgi:hypothetical protein
MTPTEIRDALRLLQKRVGDHAYINLTVRAEYHEKPVYGVIYPNGITNDPCLRIGADDWQEAITLLNEEWNNSRDRLQTETIKRMALAIIRLTAEQGECTDRALRCEFDAGDVTAFGERAVEMADQMAANGPFKVVRTAEANVA